MQFIPVDAVYPYFRYTDAGKGDIMVVTNTATEEKTIDPQRFVK
jgi:hypothetical protein